MRNLEQGTLHSPVKRIHQTLSKVHICAFLGVFFAHMASLRVSGRNASRRATTEAHFVKISLGLLISSNSFEMREDMILKSNWKRTFRIDLASNQFCTNLENPTNDVHLQARFIKDGPKHCLVHELQEHVYDDEAFHP